MSGGVAVSTSQESRWRPSPGAVHGRRRIRWLGRGEPAVVGLAAVVVAVAVWRRSPVDAGVAVLGAVALVRRWTFALGLALLAGVATVRSVDSVASLAPDRLGAFSGWVTVASDPASSHGSTRLLLQVEGERFEVWVRGPATQAARGPLAAGRPGVGLRSPSTAPSGAGGAGVVGARRRGVPLRRPRRPTRGATAGGGVEPRPRSHRTRLVVDAVGRRGPGPRSDHRRRPRRAAGHDRPLPAQRSVALDRGVGPERGVRVGRRRSVAAPRPHRRAAGGHAGADRLVRRADPGRAVGAARRRDGRAERRRVRPRPRTRARRGCSPWP